MSGGDLLLIASCLFVAVTGGYLRYRLERMKHIERLALIDKGLTPPEPTVNPRRLLRNGVLLLFTGFALSLFLLVTSESTSERMNLEEIHWRLKGHREQGMPEEWVKRLEEEYGHTSRYKVPQQTSIVGFIPAAVGIAYLLLYWLERPKRNQREELLRPRE